MQSSTSTGYFSSSTGSFVTKYRFSPIIGATSNIIMYINFQLKELLTLTNNITLPFSLDPSQIVNVTPNTIHGVVESDVRRSRHFLPMRI